MAGPFFLCLFGVACSGPAGRHWDRWCEVPDSEVNPAQKLSCRESTDPAGLIGRMPQLGWAIWAVILINAVFSFWQEFKAEKATEALKRLLPAYARVLRDGQESRVLAEELVPGDVVLLSEGDHISADGRLVSEAELRVDQSTLSGESNPVRKTSEAIENLDLSYAELPNLVFAGTSVAAGTGKAVIFATGMDSEFGKIARLTLHKSASFGPPSLQILFYDLSGKP